MPMEINITDADIAYAEKVLLPAGKTFDAERRAFIRRIDTLDLQAVPGSGKTTALLAKLVILERYLPFEDGSGILVISHTNAAVDEIKFTIGNYCRKLFSFPNFVGTIQGYVDQFLAIPYYVSQFNKRPIRIDDEIYFENASKFSENFIAGLASKDQNNAKYYLRSNENAFKYRFSCLNDRTILTCSVNGNPLNIKKPRAKTDWSNDEKKQIMEWLKEFKNRIMRAGILCFDDAYYLANLYLTQRPETIALMQKRFRYIFVDEMQDMGKHQYDLLEKLFFDNGNCTRGYQRIGDRNQAIHNIKDYAESAWQDRSTVLTLSNSYRLSAPIASVVNFFALERGHEFQIRGLGEANIKPHMVVYDDNTRTKVLENFSLLLHTLICDGRISKYDENVFKAVAWVAESSDEDNSHDSDSGKVLLVDYCPTFKKAQHKQPIDHNCFENYLIYFNKKDQTLGSAHRNIINAFLKILRLESIANPEIGSNFTGASLLKHLRENHDDYYEQFKFKLYRWSLSSVKGETASCLGEIRTAIPELLAILGKSVTQSREFIDQAVTESVTVDVDQRTSPNIVNHHGFGIELATVHSVKGQTHTATLYLETYYHKDGKGDSAKSFESQRLSGQFLKNYLTGTEGTRVKQSSKMVYVGFSRPTHLLCFAVHKDRLNGYLANIDTSAWEIIKIDSPEECVP